MELSLRNVQTFEIGVVLLVFIIHCQSSAHEL